MKNWHYYEAHVTIEPVHGNRLDLFKDLCKNYKFRVANLIMIKTGKQNNKDCFCTSRGPDYEELKSRMLDLLYDLELRNFNIHRYKIESTILDSRYDDSVFNL